MSNVFIAFQTQRRDPRPIVEAIVDDNPHAVRQRAAGHGEDRRARPPDRSSARRSRSSIGRPFDLQEMHVHLITLSGHIDETDDEFTLSWKH